MASGRGGEPIKTGRVTGGISMNVPGRGEIAKPMGTENERSAAKHADVMSPYGGGAAAKPEQSGE